MSDQLFKNFKNFKNIIDTESRTVNRHDLAKVDAELDNIEDSFDYGNGKRLFMDRARIESVDTLRIVAIISVIAIHTAPFKGILYHNTNYEYLGLAINQFSRFAVPFFFVVSGYFWGIKVRDGNSPIAVSYKMGKRIGLLFLFWSLIYVVPFDKIVDSFFTHGFLGPAKVLYWNILDLSSKPVIKLIMEGTRFHLWFFIGLIHALFINTIFIQNKLIKSLILIAILLYLVGVLGNAYTLTPLGIKFPPNFKVRYGPFFSTIFFTTGYLLSNIKVTPKWFKFGFLITVTGYFVHFLEIFILWRIFDIPIEHEFVIGTFFIGLGVAMISLSNISFLRIKKINELGLMALGIYSIHMIFVDLLRPINKTINSSVWELGYVVIVFCFSTGLSLLLAKNEFTKKVVM